MGTFYLIGAAVDGIPRFKVCADKGIAYKSFHAVSRRRTAVLLSEPGHVELEATDDDATRVQGLRDAAAAAVAGAAYAVVGHTDYTSGSMYPADGEADAARAYAGMNDRYTKVMWAADSDTAVDSEGDDKQVGVCSTLARSVLAAAAASEVDTDTGVTTDHSPAESDEKGPPAEDVKPVFWGVGKMTKDGPCITAYGFDERAQREFNAAARSSPAVLLAYPGNDVLDSAGDDAAVQEVVHAAAVAFAGATHVVVSYLTHVRATVYPAGDDAAARHAYDAVSSRCTKILWTAGNKAVDASAGSTQWKDLCVHLATSIVTVGAAAEAPASEEGTSSDEDDEPAAASASPASAGGSAPPTQETPAAAYWLVSTKVLQDGTATLKAYATAATAQFRYKVAVAGRATSAAVLLSQPGSVVLDSAGDAGAVDECVHAAAVAVEYVHRVVTWHRPNETEAALFTIRQEADARRTYSSLPVSYARSMWTADLDKPVAVSGRNAAAKAAACALGKAILTTADRPPPVVVPARYYTVTTYEDGEARVMAYDFEASARAAYRRLDDDTPRAIAGQPGNTAVESSPGNRHPLVLPNVVFRAAAAAAASVKWVMVSRVWEHAEASLAHADTASQDAAVAAYDRVRARRARGVWGADEPEPVVVRGWAAWKRRCGALAAAILGKEE